MSAPLLVTPGDPIGIGPEVTCRALAERRAAGTPVSAVLLGHGEAIEAAALSAGLPVQRVTRVGDAVVGDAVPLFVPSDADEPVEAAAIRASVALLQAGTGSALVTGPIHKARLRARGFAFTGHTDFLGHLCGGAEPVMAFSGGRMRVALVTVHIPLSAVPSAITVERVRFVVRTAHGALANDLGISNPRLVVCGLNPHAGEDGELGREELEVIGPACEAERACGRDVLGPISAEAAVRMGADDRADLVVAMYHDQGLAPLKLLDFGESVNWTLGLPIIRTSVDHGTADDIAGTGKADPSSMHAALRLAEQLVARRV